MSNNRFPRTTIDVLSLRFNQDSSKTFVLLIKRKRNDRNLIQVVLFVRLAMEFESSTSNLSLKNFFSVNLKLFFVCSSSIDRFSSDVGRATYADMLYRTNLIAYVPADHVTGLPSNVGESNVKRKRLFIIDSLLLFRFFSQRL